MNTMIINSITIIFSLMIICYAVYSIMDNNNLYSHIETDYIKLGANHNSSEIYNKVKSNYDEYVKERKSANLNITTFVEEVCSEFTYKNKSILQKLRFLKNASATTILLGVLGTFTGLCLMIISIDTSDLINTLPQTLNSMQTAFITSILGIITSIAINYVVESKSCEYILTQLMLKIENLLTIEVTHQKSELMDNKIEDVKETIKHISKSIESIERFDQISKDLNEFNNEFIRGIEALRDLLQSSQGSIDVFDQDIRKLDKQFSILNMKFKHLFDKYDGVEVINQGVLENIESSSDIIKESAQTQTKVKEYIKDAVAHLGLYERSTQDLLNKLVKHEEEMFKFNEGVKNDESKLSESVDNLSDSINISSYELKGKLESLYEIVDTYKEVLDKEKLLLNEAIYDFTSMVSENEETPMIINADIQELTVGEINEG